MPRLFDRPRRLIGTAASFALFGLGGLVVGLLVAPVMWLVYRDADNRERVMRRIIGYCFRGFVESMRLFGVLNYEISGLPAAAGSADADPNQRAASAGSLIVANHPSLIDAVFLLSMFPDADCVVKAAHWSNPFTRAAVRAANYIPNADPVEVIERCVARLAQGRQLVLFPEGTRTAPDQPARFNRGAASIALRAQASCLPVHLRCVPTTLTKADKWYDIPERKVFFTATVLEAIPAAQFLTPGTSERKASRALNDHLLQLLNPEDGGPVQADHGPKTPA